MLDINWNESKLNSFYNRMNTIKKNLIKYAEDGINNALKESKEYALAHKKGSKESNLFLIDLNKKAQEIIGRLYTNKDSFFYAPFLEWGTGSKLDSDGPGPMPAHTKTYNLTFGEMWFLPVEKANKKLNNKIWTNEDGEQFYIMFATQPYPFMRPTAFYRRKLNVDCVKKSIQKGISEDIK